MRQAFLASGPMPEPAKPPAQFNKKPAARVLTEFFMPIKKGDTVRAHYTGTLADGTVFDSSRERDPLEFTLGKGMLIPGFESAVEGHEAGETVTVTIPPDQAYGDIDPELVFTVARAQVPSHIPLEVGVPLQLSNEQDGCDHHRGGRGRDYAGRQSSAGRQGTDL